MKVLFLDIDGVLNSRKTTNFDALWPLDPYMAFMVGKIVLDTGCKIVLSSSWRHHPDGIKEIERVLGFPIFDITCKSWYSKEYGHSSRGQEIGAWLHGRKDVEKYAILDDDSDMMPKQKRHFFQTTFEEGLTPDIAKAVTAHLQ